MHFEIYTDGNGEYRWRLVARNGQIIATCHEGYKEPRDAHHGIDLVKKVTAATRVKLASP